jgi:hypothetical protein
VPEKNRLQASATPARINATTLSTSATGNEPRSASVEASEDVVVALVVWRPGCVRDLAGIARSSHL